MDNSRSYTIRSMIEEVAEEMQLEQTYSYLERQSPPPQPEESKHESLELTPEPCDLLPQMTDDCVDDSCYKPSLMQTPQLTLEPSSVGVAKGIVNDIFRKVTKPPRIIRVKKKPVMKSGWMDWKKIIPHFNIDDETFKKITFTENLLVSFFEQAGQPVPTPVGSLSLNIQSARGGPTKYQPKKTKSDYQCPKFLVHLSSQLECLGSNGGSRITSWVDRDLQTLEEKRREYIYLEEGLDQQVLYVSSQENFYYLRHDKKKDTFYSPQRAKNLICEGANFVLMRYLAISLYVGIFEVNTLYIGGGLCRNIYDCKGPSSGIVNDKKLDVCKIYRIIIEECGIEHRSKTLMSLDGEILKQEWHMCDYIIQINPLVDFTKGKSPYRIPLEKLDFRDDLQLLSLYLDAKTATKKVIQNYMEDHPEIKDMLGDYVQTILQLKPEDVFEFTAKYFLSFTPQLLPQSEYFEGPYGFDDDDDYEFWKYI